ncbi:MAG: hypothetical protein EBS53_15535, partial [Bacteroidetes bacterium]|nr:hypothetical protein [Bacteroidota bacterium]
PYSATTRRQFRAAWFALNPVTVNGVMFNLRFRVLATGNTTIKWDVATPGNCEFADEFADVIPNVSWIHSSIVCGCSPSSITAAGPTTFCQGGSVVLNAISGTGLNYQWQNNGSNISGATNASYTATTAGSYTVVVFNASTCSTVSAATIVTVTTPPSAGTLSGSQAVCVGGTSNLTSTVPGGTWSSSAPGVATVNASTGLVTGVTGGTATMTYTVTGTGGCANVSATRTITVTDPLAAVTLGGNQAVCVAGTSTFNSTISGGTWTSNDPTIATVDASSGLVTGVAAGTATISYTVTGTGGCANVSATRTITVTDPPAPGTLSGNQAVCVGGMTTFTSTVSGGTWSSSDATIATVNPLSGLVTGVAFGTTAINYTVTGTGGCSDVTGTRSVTVTSPPSAGSLSGNQAVCVGSTTIFTSTVSGGTWSSSNTAVASVNSTTGLITGVGAGTANITYTVEGTGGCLDVSSTLSIQVVEPPILTSQPLPQSVPVGQNAVFTIGYNSTNSTLQWQADLGWGFQDLTNAGQYSGVNSPTLTVSNTAFQNNNQLFRCLVYSNLCSSGVTSNIVSLSV